MPAQAVWPAHHCQPPLPRRDASTNYKHRNAGIQHPQAYPAAGGRDGCARLPGQAGDRPAREALMTRTHAAPGADDAGGALDTVRLSGGRTLTVRTVTEADVVGVDVLLVVLSVEDRNYRFFGLSHPGRKFLQQMTRAEDVGGYRRVAVVAGPQDWIVAEAGYALLPDGNGDFALTVAAGWRGWLGPYLLDALAAAAAARGVPNLQADILVTNVRMLALVSSRGYTTLDREPSQIRVAIDAAQCGAGLRRFPSPRHRPA